MLPYFRSMDAFFNLSLPKSWADLSDPQLLFLLLHDLLAIEVKIELSMVISSSRTSIAVTIFLHLRSSCVTSSDAANVSCTASSQNV